MPSSNPHRYAGGRHELGQNFLSDRRVAARIPSLVPSGAVLELGAGDGALTRRLAARRGSITAVELDPVRVAELRRALGHRVRVVHEDMLRFRLAGDHHVVSNVPFGITTPVLRHLLAQQGWRTAVLLLQWEVARKRAAIGGTTLLTASWWPWYEFTLAERVPAAAFRPRPGVDGGVLVVTRRERELVDRAELVRYQRMVRAAFGGDRLVTTLRRSHPGIRAWLTAQGLSGSARPRELAAQHWASLFRNTPRPGSSGAGPARSRDTRAHRWE